MVPPPIAAFASAFVTSPAGSYVDRLKPFLKEQEHEIILRTRPKDNDATFSSVFYAWERREAYLNRLHDK